jgi:glycosyltransferase involved in cell wall biosynthesis
MTERAVAIVCPKYHPLTCGVGDHSMRLAEELLRRGERACVFTVGPALPHPEAPQVPVVAVGRSTPSLAAAQLFRHIRRWGATEVLLQYVPHMWNATRLGSPATPLLGAALRAAGLRVNVLAHELFLAWSARPDLAAGAATQRLQFGMLLAAADQLFVTTESRLAQVLPWARTLRREERLSLLPIGSNALPVPAHPDPKIFRVGLFGTQGSGKLYDVVLDAFGQIASALPRSELLFIGDLGNRSDRQWQGLEEAVSAHPARDRIHVTGKLPLGEVGRAVARLSAYLFPMDTGANTRSGTLPLPLGCGVPVIAARGMETGSLFVGDQNVVFAQALTGEAFARAALRLHREPGLAERVAAGGRRLYEEQLAWPVLVSQLMH